MIVKAISLWEPWASLMRAGSKTVETRKWWTTHRGPLLICAALRKEPLALELCFEPEFRRGLLPVVEDGLQFGKAVALVDLVDCRQTGGAAPPEFAGEAAFGDYRAGRFMWITKNLRTFEPFDLKGKQGLFRVEIDPALIGLR